MYGEMLRTGQRGDGGKRAPFPGSPGSCIPIPFFFTFHHRYSKTQCWQSCATLTYDGGLLSDSLPHQPSLENN